MARSCCQTGPDRRRSWGGIDDGERVLDAILANVLGQEGLAAHDRDEFAARVNLGGLNFRQRGQRDRSRLLLHVVRRGAAPERAKTYVRSRLDALDEERAVGAVLLREAPLDRHDRSVGDGRRGDFADFRPSFLRLIRHLIEVDESTQFMAVGDPRQML